MPKLDLLAPNHIDLPGPIPGESVQVPTKDHDRIWGEGVRVNPESPEFNLTNNQLEALANHIDWMTSELDQIDPASLKPDEIALLESKYETLKGLKVAFLFGQWGKRRGPTDSYYEIETIV